MDKCKDCIWWKEFECTNQELLDSIIEDQSGYIDPEIKCEGFTRLLINPTLEGFKEIETTNT